MTPDLNFEAEPLLSELEFGEASDEFETVRDHRTTGGAPAARPGAPTTPRVSFAPGFGARRVFGGTPAFRGAPMFRRRFAAVPFRAGRFLGRPLFGSRFGRPSGRFGFRRRWPWLWRNMGFGSAGLGSGFDTGTFGASAASELVAWAQGCLAQITGEPVPQNGILGPATRRAIASFQTQNQLAATGVLDNQTITALQAACPEGGDGDGSGA